MNATEGYKCSKCGSFNISLDLEFGKTFCNDCPTDEQAKKFDLEEYRSDSVEREDNELRKLEIVGTKVHIGDDDKKKDPNSNDYSTMGM